MEQPPRAKGPSREGEAVRLQRTFAAFVIAIMFILCAATPAFAQMHVCGGGQIHANTTYQMVPVQSDGFLTSAKDATWTAKWTGYYGYAPQAGQTEKMYALSLVASGTTTFTSVDVTATTIVWSTTAPAVPTVTFTQTDSGHITSATIQAHETVSYKKVKQLVSKRWCKKHHRWVKKYRTVKVRIVTHDVQFWADMPELSGPLG